MLNFGQNLYTSHRKKVYVETYGCQMNVNDSEVIFSILQKCGYDRTEDIEAANLMLVNTCSVRDNAEQRIWGRLDYFNSFKKRKSDIIVGIVGCMAERLKAKLLDTQKVDLVAGPDSYRRLPELIQNITPDNPQINVMLSHEETYGDITPIRTDKNGVSAFISIMRGCNNVCSFCVVPFTRGAERSRDPFTIVAEAKDVFERGYKEVTLLGQNVDSYHWEDEKNPKNKVTFANLLEMVALISPELRVRFSTSNPQDISDEVISNMAKYDNICNYIHFPVQSGSDIMLAKMRRRYTREWYLKRIDDIRRLIPDCGITTDVIAGFCGETEEDHKDTLSLFEKVCFDQAYMFYYSERPGTLAARKYPDDVSIEDKTRRLNEIIALQGQCSLKSNQRELGKIFKVLIEGTSKKNVQELKGRTSSNKMCVFPIAINPATGENYKAGEYVFVKAKQCSSATLICEIASDM